MIDLDVSQRRLACLAGVAMMFGMRERQANVDAAAAGTTPPTPTNFCELAADDVGAAVCRENSQACSVPGACGRSLSLFSVPSILTSLFPSLYKLSSAHQTIQEI